MRLCGSMSWNEVCVAKTEKCRSDIYGYFNVNFNVLFKLITVLLLLSDHTYIRMHGATIKIIYGQLEKLDCCQD